MTKKTSVFISLQQAGKETLVPKDNNVFWVRLDATHKGKLEKKSGTLLLKQTLQLPFTKHGYRGTSRQDWGSAAVQADTWQETLPLQKNFSSSSAGREKNSAVSPIALTEV